MDPYLGLHQLQNRVQFDICYYLIRRSQENIINMTKDTFDLVFGSETKITYVKKVKDKLTKNHKEVNGEITMGFMPQIMKEDGAPHKMCPVRSYEKYTAHLSPNSDFLWQQPLKKIPTNPFNLVWYKSKQLGHNSLENFMGNLSTICQLSDYYTNPCIHVTGITNLTHKNYTPCQIMSISGHWSLSSLAIYQRVKADEKLMMGMSLTYSVFQPR